MNGQQAFGRSALRPDRLAPLQERQRWRRRAAAALPRIRATPAIPPRSILVINRLSDPAPGTLRLDTARPDTDAWEHRLQARLAECWREAARPAQGPVPPSANAVWFADPAEWLACLSWDIHRGVAHGRWWWQHWFSTNGNAGVGNSLIRLWQAEARWLPSALSLLHELHGEGLFPLLGRVMIPSGVGPVRQSVTQAHKLQGEIPAPEMIALVASALPVSQQPLLRALPEEAAALLALCLAITRAPGALAAYRRHDRSAIDRTSAFPRPAAWGSADRPAAPATGSAGDESRPVPGQSGDLPLLPAAPSQAGAVVPPERGEFTGGAAAKPRIDRPTPARDKDRVGSPRPVSGEPEVTEDADLLREKPTPLLALQQRAAEEGLRTALGGLWYLVNVLADLGWLVEVDVAPEDLNPWHQLQGLALALLPEAPPDPVWAVLLSLAGEGYPQPLLAQWLAQALPAVDTYLAERLQEACSVPEVLLEPALLYVTRTHVDVRFRLDQIRLPLRRAGLDRNPGWVPELARIITFHFD